MVVINDVAVRFVGNQVDRGVKPLASRIQHPPQLLQVRLRVDLPGGIVGTVDQHHLGLFGQPLLNGLQIKVKLLVRGHHLDHTTVVVDVKMIFDEKGRQHHDLVTRIEQGLEDDVQAARCTAGHEDIAQLQVSLLLPPQSLGQGFTNKGKTGIGHITVHPWFFVPDQFLKHRVEFCRRRHIGIADAEIKDLVRPELGFHPGSLFEHLPDPGGTLCIRLHLFRHTTHPAPLLTDLIGCRAPEGLTCVRAAHNAARRL